MNIETMIVGPIETNCYIISDPETREAVIIDAGDEEQDVLDYVQKHNLQVKYLLNTHGHYDHIQANDYLREHTGAKLGIHADDVELLLNPDKIGANPYMHGCKEPDMVLHNGDSIFFGPYELRVIYTPGHSRGGCCFYEVKEKVCFTGDTLFRGTIGRTDLYGGSYPELLKSVRERMKVVADDVTVYPGHGTESTMGFERKTNMYLK